MRKQVAYIIIILVCSSCATVLNTGTQKINVSTSRQASFRINNINPTYYTDSYGSKITIGRDSVNLLISFQDSSTRKSIEIPPHNSFAYWLNAYPTPLLWTGFLIDRHKLSRYAYPKNIYVDIDDTLKSYYTYYPWSRKGQIHGFISAPYINMFNFFPEHELDRKINTGFWGLKIGLEYYYGNRSYICLATYGAMDFFVPFPAAVDFFGEVENMYTRSVSLTSNHWLGNFSFGYGVSFNSNTWALVYWDHWDPPPPTRPPVRINYSSIGLEFPLKYQFGNHFYLGAFYRPSFYRFINEKQFTYEHLISIEFGWKFNSMH